MSALYSGVFNCIGDSIKATLKLDRPQAVEVGNMRCMPWVDDTCQDCALLYEREGRRLLVV